ncbi:MAG: group II truncated hemoglobin [Rhizomicrobium sp.]
MSETAEPQIQVLPYELIGGDAGLRKLIDRFYDIMDSDPSLAELRALHGADLAPMRQRLFEFMSGWLGGPRLYDSCVISAHRRFAIGERERDQWLVCMKRAMADMNLPKSTLDLFAVPFARMADAMKNK